MARSVLFIFLCLSGFVQPVAADPTIVPRVRDTGDPVVAALLAEARANSPTFRRLIERIDATNGIVYVEQGACPPGFRACLLLSVVLAGPNRILRIHVDLQREKGAAMAAVGHELQHAIEALEERGVTTGALLYGFFERLAGSPSATGQLAFETEAAVHAGDQVQLEIQAHQRATSHVRTKEPRILGLIDAGLSRSDTFRRLVDTLNASDVVVYVEPKLTREQLGGYLAHNIVFAGGQRYVHIAVETQGAQRRLVAVLAHELQHAVEVAQDPLARDPESVQQTFNRLAIPFGCGGTCSETRAAIEVESIVAQEFVHKTLDVCTRPNRRSPTDCRER